MTLAADHRPEPFRIERAMQDGVPVVAVFGEVDVHTAPDLRSELRALHHDEAAVVDLCTTDFMDSSGLAVLLDEAVSFAGGLHIACQPAGPVSRLIAATKTNAALCLHDNRDAALAAARSR